MKCTGVREAVEIDSCVLVMYRVDTPFAFAHTDAERLVQSLFEAPCFVVSELADGGPHYHASLSSVDYVAQLLVCMYAPNQKDC